MKTMKQSCFICAENTYSTTGTIIDGVMGDWDRVTNSEFISAFNHVEISSGCYV
jgi:hypothetical protein